MTTASLVGLQEKALDIMRYISYNAIDQIFMENMP